MDKFIEDYNNYNGNNIKIEYECDDINNVTVEKNISIKNTLPPKLYNYDSEFEKNIMFDDLFVSYLINKYEPITDSIKIKLLFKKLVIPYDKLFDVKIIDDALYINGKIQMPLIFKNTTQDKRFTYYEIFREIKFLSPNHERLTTNCSFQIIGPDEIKSETLYLISDFYEMAELFRKNMSDYNVGNNNILFFKPMEFGKQLKYNSIRLHSEDYTNLQIKYYENKMEIFNDYEDIIKRIDVKIDLFDIREMHYMRIDHCLYESKNLLHYMIYINVLLTTLAKGGSVILSIRKIFTTATVELLYFLSLFFKKIIFFADKKEQKGYRLIFIYFKGCSDSKLKGYRDILKEVIGHEESLGANINIENQNDTNCSYYPYEKNYEKNNVQIFFHNIFKFKCVVDGMSKFIQFIESINNYLISNIKIYNELHRRLQHILTDSTIHIDRRKKLVDKLLELNLHTSINWCIKNEINFNNIFETLQSSERNKNIINYFFPPGVNFNKIQMTNESYYSVSSYKDAEYTTELIKQHLKQNTKELIITDGCSNVGGNTLNFLKNFKFVNAVEYDKTTSVMLENNIKLYGFSNYKVYNNDYTKIMNNLQQDVVFLDPPWGGIKYKYYDTINLYLSNTSLADIVGKIINSVQLICIKVPDNFDIVTLYEKKFKEIHIYKLKKYKIVIVKA